MIKLELVRIEKRALALCVLFPMSTLAAVTTAEVSPAPSVRIEAARLSRHTRTLASNEFEGRAPGTLGEQKTVAYIIEQLKAFGVVPGGEEGSYTQNVRMNRYTIAAPPTLAVRATNPGCDLTLGADEVVVFTKRPAPQVEISAAPLVFAGHGIDAPTLHWNDYAGVDLRGKIAVVLANDPDHEALGGPFEGPAMTYFGRIGYKAEEAMRKGALAVLTINHPKASGFEWPLVRSLYGPPAQGIVSADQKSLTLEGWIKLEAAEKLIACAGRNLESLRQAAKQPGFSAVPLTGLTLSTRFAVKVEPQTTQNVVGIVRGTERPLETFVYTAHWDHLGRGKPDATGDDIYNGAMDNAAGVAGLLELARVFAAEKKPRRSIAFIATTLEESGLLGSEYFAAHPLFPLETVVGGINMDAVNIFGPTKTMEVTGLGKTTLEDLLDEELKKTGRTVRQDPNSVVGFYFRSDHFPFVKRGVPFLFTGSGWELADKRFPNRRDPKLGTRFHQPSDEWSEELDFEAAARDLRIYHAVGRRLANSAEWPTWKPGVEWKSIRETSAAARR